MPDPVGTTGLYVQRDMLCRMGFVAYLDFDLARIGLETDPRWRDTDQFSIDEHIAPWLDADIDGALLLLGNHRGFRHGILSAGGLSDPMFIPAGISHHGGNRRIRSHRLTGNHWLIHDHRRIGGRRCRHRGLVPHVDTLAASAMMGFTGL